MSIEKMNQTYLGDQRKVSFENLNRPEIMRQDPQCNTEEMAKKIGQDLEAAAVLGKSLVKSVLKKDEDRFNNVGWSLNQIVDDYDKEFKDGGNSFKNIEDFKNAGGYFDEHGKALVNGEPFNGIIRLNYDEEYPEDTVYSRYNARQYAKFDDDGHLSEILTVEKGWNGVTLDTVKIYNPDTSVASYEIVTQKFTGKNCHNKGYETLLENYGIS